MLQMFSARLVLKKMAGKLLPSYKCINGLFIRKGTLPCSKKKRISDDLVRHGMPESWSLFRVPCCKE